MVDYKLSQQNNQATITSRVRVPNGLIGSDPRLVIVSGGRIGLDCKPVQHHAGHHFSTL